MLWGHKYTSMPTISHREGRADTQQSTLHWRILSCGYITQLHMRLRLIIQKSTRPLSTIMLAWEAHEREDEPEMADVLNNLVMSQKLAHIRPRRHKHDSSEPSSRKSQQGGGNKSNIPLKQWKRLQMLTMHMLHSKHFFKCNASLDNSYNFKLLRTKMQQRRLKIVILRPLQRRAIAP